MPLTPNRRIDIVPTAREALDTTLLYAVPYVLLAWVCESALAFLSFGVSAIFGPAMVPGPTEDSYVPQVVPILVLIVLNLLINSAFALAWFRYLLLGPVRPLGLPLPALNSMMWHLCGKVIGISFAGALVLMSVGQVAALVWGSLTLGADGTVPINTPGFMGLMALVILLAIAAMLRLSLALPASALGFDVTLISSFRALEGNSWRLFSAVLLLSGVAQLAVFAAARVLSLFLPLENLFMAPSLLDTIIHGFFGPLTFAPFALACAVIAIVYRDLSGEMTAEEDGATASV